jgi:hypothetical protein
MFAYIDIKQGISCYNNKKKAFDIKLKARKFFNTNKGKGSYHRKNNKGKYRIQDYFFNNGFVNHCIKIINPQRILQGDIDMVNKKSVDVIISQ